MESPLDFGNDDPDCTTQILKLDLPVAPTVLIVDDDELVLARLRELVLRAGYNVSTAGNGEDALEALRSSPVSIVVTDLTMPGMDGLQLCKRIREQTNLGYIYIILLTVRDEEQDILSGLAAGADDYLSKRTSAAQFTARLGIAKRVLSLEYSLKIALDKKHQLAMTDPLTGIYNRRYFMRHIGRELKRSQRFGGDLSVLLLDIDNFKTVNDAHGHPIGDMVLNTLTRTIGNCLKRTTDWCARLGGEEFAIVLEGTNPADAQVCAEKVRRAIANSASDTPHGRLCVTVSIGISSLKHLGDRRSVTVQSLLEQADANLYKSKAAGRNRVTSSIAPSRHIMERSDDKARIRTAR